MPTPKVTQLIDRLNTHTDGLSRVPHKEDDRYLILEATVILEKYADLISEISIGEHKGHEIDTCRKVLLETH